VAEHRIKHQGRVLLAFIAWLPGAGGAHSPAPSSYDNSITRGARVCTLI
jgi:hypothetical protein